MEKRRTSFRLIGGFLAASFGGAIAQDIWNYIKAFAAGHDWAGLVKLIGNDPSIQGLGLSIICALFSIVLHWRNTRELYGWSGDMILELVLSSLALGNLAVFAAYSFSQRVDVAISWMQQDPLGVGTILLIATFLLGLSVIRRISLSPEQQRELMKLREIRSRRKSHV